MRTLPILFLGLGLAGCALFGPTAVERNFGAAVMTACARQVADPAAAARHKGAPGLDGVAANHAVDNYEKSFCAPPPPTNIYNIGVGGTNEGVR